MKLLIRNLIQKRVKKCEKSLTPLALKFEKFICWIFTGEKEKGLDPVFYDGLFYCGNCFCLWVVAGISISTYFYYHYYTIAAIACGILTPIISFLICIHLIKRVLESGISKFKKGKNE